jgi:hypothetical protein
MTVSVSQHYQVRSGGSTTLTKSSVVVGSGEGLLVLVFDSDAASGSAASTSGVDWNGAALTQFGNTLTSNDGVGAAHRQSCWYLPNPTPGTQTVTATFGSAPLVTAMEVIVVAGHDTTTMVRAWDGSAVGSASVPTVTLTTVSGDLLIDLARIRTLSGDPVASGPTSGQTSLDGGGSPISGAWFHLSSSKSASGTSTTMSWVFTDAGDTWVTQAVAIAPSSGAAGVYVPNSDVTVTGWTSSAGGSLYATVDEATPDDSDYIVTPTITSSTAPATFGLNQTLPAGNYTVGIRAKTSSGTATLRAYLLNGSNTSQGVTADQTITSTFTTYSLPITTTGSATRIKIEVVS